MVDPCIVKRRRIEINFKNWLGVEGTFGCGSWKFEGCSKRVSVSRSNIGINEFGKYENRVYNL